jgi:hypothetical protein
MANEMTEFKVWNATTSVLLLSCVTEMYAVCTCVCVRQVACWSA